MQAHFQGKAIVRQARLVREIKFFELVKLRPSFRRVNGFTMAHDALLRPQVQGARHRRNWQGKIFYPQIFQRGTFHFEVVHAFKIIFLVVLEIHLNTVFRAVVSLCDLKSEHDALIRACW